MRTPFAPTLFGRASRRRSRRSPRICWDGAVALDAVLSQDGLDITSKVHVRRRGPLSSRRPCQQKYPRDYTRASPQHDSHCIVLPISGKRIPVVRRKSVPNPGRRGLEGCQASADDLAGSKPPPRTSSVTSAKSSREIDSARLAVWTCIDGRSSSTHNACSGPREALKSSSVS